MPYESHDVIINKDVGLKDAKQIAKKFINPKKKYQRETDQSYRFRNTPKTKFEEFRSKNINNDITLIFGK